MRRFLPILLLALLSVPAVWPLFLPGFPNTHDGLTHVVRFVKFHQALSEGQFPPRWADGIAFGLGSPVLMYNAFLPYLTAELPRLLGVSWSSSIEIIFAFSLILSGVTFYLWAKEIFGKLPGFAGALFYVYAPYRFIDIYVRGAYPESFAFIFPPLLLLSIKKLLENYKAFWMLLLVLSLSGLILSHNVMAILFMAIGLVYGGVLALAGGEVKKLWRIGFGFGLAVFLTAVFWMPAFFEKGEVNLDYLNSTASYLTNFASLNNIIYSKWGWGPLNSSSPMSLQLGLTQLTAVLLTAIISILLLTQRTQFSKKIIDVLSSLGIKFNFKNIAIQKFHLILFSILLIAAIFFMTFYSVFFWKHISLLSFFLYPWRFLTLIVFSTAVIASFLIFTLRSNVFLVGFLVLLLLYSNRNFSQLVGSTNNGDLYYEGYHDTTDMWGEFLPATVDLNMVKKCKVEDCAFAKVISPENVILNNVKQRNDSLGFSYSSENNFPLTVNTFNFPGWNITLDDKAQEPIKTNRMGTMDLDLPGGAHSILLTFGNTFIRTISTYISLVGLVVLIGYLWKRKI